MLRITVEIVPFGVEANKRTLGIAEIINDGSGNRDFGNYSAVFSSLSETVKIRRFRREDGFWRLLRRAIGKAFPNKPSNISLKSPVSASGENTQNNET